MTILGSDRPVARNAEDIVSSNMKIDTQLERCKTAQSEGGRTLLAFYEEHHANGAPIRRSQMPARQLLAIMPHLFMLERADEVDTDWCLRLVGQGVVERTGLDPTGLLISQAYKPDVAEHNAGDYRDIAMNHMVRITRGTFTGINREYLTREIVHVPMIGADDTTPWVLGGLFVSNAA